ncbi:MAG: hypothetical protein J6A01_01660, partial [Proteobacteria bacterium]|nr:hypothetical protein [Pseudomonadota bacterium]
IIHYPLSIIHYSLFIIHYPLSIIHYSLSIIHYPLSIIPRPIALRQYGLRARLFSKRNTPRDPWGCLLTKNGVPFIHTMTKKADPNGSA